MKKLLTLLAFAGLFSLVACGPSKEEQDKEKARMDSIRTDSLNKVTADSLSKVADKMRQDSMANAANMEKMRQDSMAAAAAKPAKKGKKK